MFAFVCKPCRKSDPAQDTIKPNFSNLPGNDDKDGDKENSKPNQESNDTKMDEGKARLEAERREREMEAQRAEEAQRRQEQEFKKRQEEEALERLRQEEEEEEKARRRNEEEHEELQRREQEAQRSREAEEVAQRDLEEKERKQAEEQRVKEESEAKDRVDTWLKKNGFASVSAKKKSMMSWHYPLHSAVTKNDSAMVQLLMRFDADPQIANSSKQTPRQLADKLNKKGSHNEILAVLPSV